MPPSSPTSGSHGPLACRRSLWIRRRPTPTSSGRRSTTFRASPTSTPTARSSRDRTDSRRQAFHLLGHRQTHGAPIGAHRRPSSSTGIGPRRRLAERPPALAATSNPLALRYLAGAPSEPIQEAGSRDEEDPSRRERHPRALVQHPPRHAGAAGSVPEPTDAAADGPSRPGAALSAGDHRARGVGRAVDRDPGSGPRDLQDLAPEPGLPG